MWMSLKQTGVCWYVWPSILASWRHANMMYPVPGNKARRSIACPVIYASSNSGDETSTSTVLAKLLADVAVNWSAVGTRQLSEWSQCTSDDNIGVLSDTGNSTGGYNAIGFTLTPFTYSLRPRKHNVCTVSITHHYALTYGCRISHHEYRGFLSVDPFKPWSAQCIYAILYTLWTIKRWQYICDHNFGKS